MTATIVRIAGTDPPRVIYLIVQVGRVVGGAPAYLDMDKAEAISGAVSVLRRPGTADDYPTVEETEVTL